MSETVDIAVFGATPLARLLAGLLSETHGKRVVLVADASASYRLAHGIDLSVAPITRPDLWALLAVTVPETLKLLGRISNRNGFTRIDPVFLAASPVGRQALAHVRQMSSAFGHDIQRLPEDIAGAGRDGIIVRDAAVLNRAGLEPDLDAFLAKANVRLFDPTTTSTTLSGSGATLVDGEHRLVADLAIFADDQSILAHLERARLAPAFTIERAVNILTEPTKMPHGPVVLDLDTGACLLQRPSFGVSAICTGSPSRVVPVIGSLLARHEQLRQAGQAVFDRLVSNDGAPRLGPLEDGGPVLLAGFGITGAFLAPAIARWIAGRSPHQERQTLAQRATLRPEVRPGVAEYRPHALNGAVS